MVTLFKYLVWLVVSLICLLFATITISEYLVDAAIDAPYDDRLSELGRALAASIQAHETEVRIAPGAVQLHATDSRDRVFYAVRDARGNVIAGDRQMALLAFEAVAGHAPLSNRLLGDEQVRVASFDVADPRNEDETLTVQVAETLNKRKVLVEALRTQAVALPELLVLVAGVLLIVYGYSFVLRPMHRLRILIDRRGADDLSALDPQAAPHDLQPLIQSINGMMERLAAGAEAQRRFIADAAHQLRTPLAGIKSQTERALDERDPTAARNSLARASLGVEHAIALANRLLTLARAGTPLPAPSENLDLIGIVSDTIVEHLPSALERGHDLGFEGPPGPGPYVVRGDALLLREMLSNLIDNALRYSPNGGAITVSVDRDAESGCYTLSVSDTGPGISPEERERVFEPFYRGADVVGPGTGLGLAIVRTIATVHGASVALSNGPGDRGLRVTVQFPGTVPLAA